MRLSVQGRLLVATVLLVLPSTSAQALIQDFQVARIILHGSDCALTSLKRGDARDGKLMFLGTCSNLSFYPEGIVVACSEPDDERTCVVLTQAKVFRHLELFKPRD